MSTPEIAYRVNWKIKQDVYYRFLTRKPQKKFLINNTTTEDAFDKFKQANKFWFQEKGLNINQIYSTYFSETKANKIIEEADKSLKHIFNISDIQGFQFDDGINWNIDIKTKKTWPEKYQGDIYFHSPEFGGVLYVWLLNRFTHFYRLGSAFQLTKDEKYASEIINQISSWIEQNPYLIGVNWTSPLEMSIRVIAWIWALEMIKESNALSKEFFSRVIQVINFHADYIYNNLSLHGSANNHLIGEVSGLVFVGSFLPFLKNAEKWKKKGLSVLEDEIPKQILEILNK